MKLKNRALGALVGLCALIALGGNAVAADRSYTEGTVSVVSAIRTEPGMLNTYLNYLATTYKPLMEAQKAAGLILDYRVYEAQAQSPQDADLILTITYKNMAAMDGLSDRMDAIQEKYVGDQAKRDAAMVERGKMRTMLGSEMLRRYDLK